MSGIKLKSSGGGSITLQPVSVGVDVNLNLPAANSTLLIASDLAASSGSSGIGYLPVGTDAVATTVQKKLREVVSALDFGADPTGVTDSTLAIQRALNSLTAGGTVIVPAGTYSVKSVTIPYSHTALVGDENSATKFVSPAGRWGQTVICNDKDFVTVKNITFDNDLAYIEGAMWFGGTRNCLIERCSFLNGEQTSMIISGAGGVSGGTRIAYDNMVRDCYAKGQKSYHPNGTSPFIAGNNAQRTSFVNCVVEDCEADAFDADNAPYTKFINCKATKTGEVRAAYAGFWSECTEVNLTGYEVMWENCVATNYGVGFGTSEYVQGTMINPIAFKCTQAIWHHSNAGRLTVIGGTFDSCGDNSATSGAVLLEYAATLDGVVFRNTQYNNAIQIFSGSALPDVSVHITKCSVDKNIALGYENNGPMEVRVSGCVLTNANISWYNCANKTVLIDGNVFNSGGIAGTRISNAIVTNNIFRDGNSVPTLTAIDLASDTFNTFFSDNVFIYYLNVTNNGTAGRNTYVSCTNIPKDTRDFVTRKRIVITTGGTNYSISPTARGSYLLLVQGEANDHATGAYLIQGTSYTGDHSVTILGEKPDFGTANKFAVTFPSGGPIQITHPTSGRVANCVLLAYDI